MADHKEEKEEKPEKRDLDEDITHKQELHEDVVKAEAEPDDEIPAPAPEPEQPAKKKFDFKALFSGKNGKRNLIISAAVVAVIATLFIVPVTRYGILGTFIKHTVNLTIMDNTAKHAVTDASVQLAGMTATSDNTGKVSFTNVPVGEQTVKVTKKYYKDYTGIVGVWVFSPSQPASLNVEATGRVVPIQVTNKLTGKGLEGVKVSAGDSTAITDYKGTADLVVPADLATVNGKITLDGYNDKEISVLVSEKFGDNNFELVPAGKLHFLSKRTGKISVMKSDLDGGNVEVVLAGTGKESETNTVLLASRDWKYLALLSSRDGPQKLYLIDTTDHDKLSVIDEGKAEFSPLGWVDHDFVYKVTRTDINDYHDYKYSIKSFNVATDKLRTLDYTFGVEYSPTNGLNQYYNSGPFLLRDDIIFGKAWQQDAGADHKSGVYSVKADGSAKKTLAEGDTGYQITPYGPNEAYLAPYDDLSKGSEYEDGKVTAKKLTSEQVYAAYNTYLQSPSGKSTFWTEQRDGLTVLLIGDDDGKNDRSLGAYDQYLQYGWYTDNYVLISKNSSELYITSIEKDAPFTKVTDYHKPAYNYGYYGGGYGGF